MTLDTREARWAGEEPPVGGPEPRLRIGLPAAVVLALFLGAGIVITAAALLSQARDKGNETRRIVTKATVDMHLTQLLAAVQTFQARYGRAPANLSQLVTPPPLKDGTRPAAFLARPLTDPWVEKPYVYGTDAQGSPYVESLGADGLPGGTGDDADVRHTILPLTPTPGATGDAIGG